MATRYCDLCGTPLHRKQGWPTRRGGISCGRSETMRTLMQGDKPSLVKAPLPCAKAAGF